MCQQTRRPRRLRGNALALCCAERVARLPASTSEHSHRHCLCTRERTAGPHARVRDQHVNVAALLALRILQCLLHLRAVSELKSGCGASLQRP